MGLCESRMVTNYLDGYEACEVATLSTLKVDTVADNRGSLD